MQLLMSGLGALIMLSVCGLSGFFIVADERRGHSAHASAPLLMIRELSSRGEDPQPLSVDDVFPQREITMGSTATPYLVRLKHSDTDCNVAVTGSLGRLLDDHGCSQVVRATMVAPHGNYLVTGGLFNLADEAGAIAVSDQLRAEVDSGAGSFAGMSGGPGTEALTLPSAQVGWHQRGHYLLYGVIARPDGEIVRDDDPYARRIVDDIISSYLRKDVLGRRAATPV